ncbi:MAG: transglycosylase domain-containing protein [Pigmentiphaga sp.]|nr:transglycosylase domain-containing protein [Pigmentiphaga sp.]
MRRENKLKEVYDHIGGKPVTCVDIKGWLIFYNIVLDKVLENLNKNWIHGSIASNDELYQFERYVILIEDRRFFKHRGFDIYCLARILRQLAERRRLGGVSTIEQQYIRTYLNRRDRTLGRKFHEIVLAWLLSHRTDKKKILRAYLNTAYFGYQLNSCDAASQLVFDKPASNLLTEEAAFLASLLVYPLPKSIITLAQSHALFPVQDIGEFLSITRTTAPWWSARISARVRYSMQRMAANTEKPK